MRALRHAITFCITVCLNGRGTVEHGTVGLQVTLAASNVILDEAMTRFDVPHTYEPAMATIRNKVPERFEGNVLPFFFEESRVRASGNDSETTGA